MKSVLSLVACLLVCGSLVADEKKSEPQQKKTVVDVKVLPKVGVPTPVIRPRTGQHYWRHPNFGWGYWYYPAPVAAPQNYYVDQFGRVVPNGYMYDQFGALVPFVAPAPVYSYPYAPYYYGRWGGWWR